MNTTTVARRLEEGGFTREQATALLDVLRDEVLDEVATKEHVTVEVNQVRAEVNHLREDVGRLIGEIDRLAQDTGNRLDALRNELKEFLHLVVSDASARLEAMIHREVKSTVKWMAGMLIVQTVAILTGTIGLLKILS